MLVQEDTDCDGLITVDDKGPKLFVLEIDAKSGSGFFKVSGNYAISVLLQELSLATTSSLLLSSKVFTFSPVERLSMMIRNIFWPSLTRTIDCHGTMEIFKDPKVNDNKNGTLRVYVGYYDTKGLQYFKHARKKNPKLQAIRLPKRITPGYMREIRHKPGILALKIDYGIGGCLDDARGVPYVVPGGRFNEMYGWDSYFIALGLLADGNVNLARSIADNLLFQVQNYGKVLNANRSYYLGRSHPPFLTDLLRQIYDKTPAKNEALVDWLCDAFALAIKEYWGVWCSDPRFVEACGLSRYMPESTGMSRETESSHYDSVFKPIADAYGMTVEQLKRTYSEKHKKCPKSRLFDKYFCHDQSMRESGHDTTYRLDNVSADLLPVDLNCLLYKYERDIAWFLREFCDEETLIWRDEDSDYTLRVETHDLFESRAKKRRQKIFDLMWSRRDGLLYDYNYKARRSSRYKSATVFYALWSGICGERHARKIVRNLPTFEMEGGVVSGSKDSLQTKNLSLLRPNRQWDHPYGTCGFLSVFCFNCISFNGRLGSAPNDCVAGIAAIRIFRRLRTISISLAAAYH